MTVEQVNTADAVQTLLRVGTVEVYETLGGDGLLDPEIRPLWSEARICGPAFPVECQPGDKLMAIYAALKAEAGDVAVVGTKGLTQTNYWGRIMSDVASERGLAGVVLDGCVRDSAALKDTGLPIFCRGICLRNTPKVSLGTHGRPVTVGNQTIAPGDMILGDHDGVLVIPKERLAEVLDVAAKRFEAEMASVAAIKSDVATANVLKGGRRALQEAGLL